MKDMNTGNTLNFTAVLVEDKATKGYTAFFAQLPNIIAEGDTEDLAVQNLIELAKVVFEHQRETQLHSPEMSGMNTVTTRSLQFAIA